MKTRRLLLVPLLCAAGCAGDSARINATAPAMLSAWPGVKDDANFGIAARQNVAAANALGVPVESPGVAGSRTERVSQFDTALRTLTTK